VKGWVRVAAVRDHPHALDDYRAWLKKREGPRDYLFADDRVRFEPRREDMVVPLPGLEVAGAKQAELVVKGARLPVGGATAAAARRVIEAMDGERCLVELAWIDRAALAAVLRAGFGKVIFAPATIETLEAEVPSVEIARFPAPPYAIERSYWANAAAVRRLAHVLDDARDPHGWLASLRSLHVVALMGERLESFYQPASPGADEAVHPGALFGDPVRLIRRGDRAVFLDGPRVNAKLLREDYAMRLFTSLGDEAALRPRAVSEEISWGEVVLARSERDDDFGPWFCPPRPLTEAHLESLFDAWRAGDWASFHWRFVRLHPFRCGNQSLAMGLVNARLPIGIPHLLLDLWALRLTRAAYAELFARAVAHWAIAGDPATRLRRLMDLRTRFEATVRGDAHDEVALLAPLPQRAP
jgi:hypothetical protein